MTNYVKSTNFTSKDTLPTGNPLKIVKGSEIDIELNNIATAVASKADSNAPTFTGLVSVPTAAFGTDTGQAASTAFVQSALQALHPVGSIYINATNSANPSTLFGFGTWVAFGAGRVPVGFDSGDTLFNAAEKTGGSKDAVVVSHTHTATTSITDPGHNHISGVPADYGVYGAAGTSSTLGKDGTLAYSSSPVTSTSTTGITAATTVNSSGVSGTNANLQPYITVYMWKRTA